MISLILPYNSDDWGTFVKSDFKSWDNVPIEKTHLQFCERLLEVHNKASNMASRAELGKYPMINLTNRFHVAVRLFSNRSQMTSKCGKNKKVAHEAIAECVTDVLTTF